MEDFVQFPVVRDRWKAYDSHEEHEAHERCEFINCYLVPALILLLSHAFKGELVAVDHYVLQQGFGEEQEEGAKRRTWHNDLRTDMLLK